MNSSQTSDNPVADLIQYMASYDSAQNGDINIDSSSSEDDEIEIVKETIITTENHRCDLCNEGEFLVDKLLRFGGVINEKYKFVCDKCDENFELKSQLKEHSSKCQGLDCHQTVINNSSQNKTPGNSQKGDNSFLIEKELITCKICFKILKSQSGLTRHMTYQHSNVTHTCEVCKAVFDNFMKFRNHCSTHQMENKKYSCDLCSKSFYSNVTLKKHVEKKHNNG